jgi:RNA-directed DNA polymerase
MNRLAASCESTGSKRKILQEPIEDEVMRTWLEAQDSASNENVLSEWTDWNEMERHVYRLQRQLANAVEHGNRKAIRHYKWLIRNSQHAKLLAIRSVTQENNGRRTPGVDGKVYTTPEARNELLTLVNLQRRPLPVRGCTSRKRRKTTATRYPHYP